MKPEAAQHYIKWGATPKAIEESYAYGRISELCRETGFQREEIFELARRWGIDRQAARNAVR